MCDSTTEFWCKAPREDMCIPKQSRCNLAIDCDDSYDEIDCTGMLTRFKLFNNSNDIYALY